MNAEIITIGDELLIGQVVDTNSAWMATELNKLGIRVVQITSVSDKRESIIRALDDASGRAELIITTGGLGPTSDDITKNTLVAYFDSKLIRNQAVLEHIETLLKTRGVAMNDFNISQADLPDNCQVLYNSAGTAPGMWFSRNQKEFVSLPGVPYEMKAVYKESMEPKLKQRFALPAIMHKTILTCGVPESQMAVLISNWENALPANLKLAYLPSPGILRLRITGTTTGDQIELKTTIENEAAQLEQIIGAHVFGYDEDKLEVIVGNLLNDNNLSLSTAESCTGGLISFMITSVPGSSAYYQGGVVAYSNDVKTSQLNVSPYSLIMNGAVSQPVVEQMADGARNKFNTDFAVAVSGIAGPSGATEEKPVGTTWIAVASKKRIVSHLYNLGEDRSRNMQKAAISALFMLRKEIMDCL
ncbi:MAG: competence/damage-inducible protein A [Bacteroidales bacterium]|nr:competence/damage-inducible protein A [Bacteroidales bacterium]